MSNKIKGMRFEILEDFKDILTEADKPRRQTLGSAGYDICAAEDITIEPIWVMRDQFGMLAQGLMEQNAEELVMRGMIAEGEDGHPFMTEEGEAFLLDKLIELADEKMFRATMVKTGLTAFMPEDMVLKIHVRSSVGFKKLMTLANSVGIIDSDYSNVNPETGKRGHIMIPMINFGFAPRYVKKGEAIAQGIFERFFVTEDDNPVDKVRVEGFGHTNDNKNV